MFSSYNNILCAQGEDVSQAVIEPSDAFGRMLVHGLAQFHGLASSSRCNNTLSSAVTISIRARPDAGSYEAVPAQTLDSMGHSRFVTCADILMAMAELGEHGLDQKSLDKYLSRAGLDYSLFTGTTSE